MMEDKKNWFEREKDAITTPTSEKRETPDGLWYKCPKCKTVVTTEDHADNLGVCGHCGHHERVNAETYFQIFFDEGQYKELDADMTSVDPLEFTDTKSYKDRVAATQKKTGLKDALRSATGKSNGRDLTIAAFDFGFIGGSMGSVVGEKIARAVDYSLEHKTPFMIISKSGGARMMEAAISLMQLAKTSGRLARLDMAKIPYISLCTHPTTGGTTASFAMLGDINIAEPGALIGFAGPRVVKETIGKDLPEGFQTAEFVQDHGFLDFIVERKDLKARIGQYLDMVYPAEK